MKRLSAFSVRRLLSSSTSTLKGPQTKGPQSKYLGQPAVSGHSSEGTASQRLKRQNEYDAFKKAHASAAAGAASTASTISKEKGETKIELKPLQTPHEIKDYLLPHPIWDGEYINQVKFTHLQPPKGVDRAAMYAVKIMRFNFDWMTGYSWMKHSEKVWLTRLVFLETVAGVPGSVGGILRHLRSLRRMERDHGWIHTLFEDAENERMHLLTCLQLRNPGKFMHFCVFMAQGIFFNFFFLSYLLSPRFAHRFVGYLEEEAVMTYTKLLAELDAGLIPGWHNKPAPEIAIKYWKMKPESTLRDVFAVIRADEAHHRDVNHGFASLKQSEENPFNRHDKNFTVYADQEKPANHSSS